LREGTGMAHVAHTVPLGSWGGHERAWAVTGPAVGLSEPDLGAEQAAMRAQLAEDARAKLRQAERAHDWRAQVDEWMTLDRLGIRAPESP
jgi:hypothetical protein